MSEKNGIHTRALLANVRVHMWQAHKHDRKASAANNKRHKADDDASKVTKALLGGRVGVLSKLNTAAHTARTTHYEHTLPWSDDGWRILPTANYTAYTEAMRKAKARFDKAVEEFVEEYPRLTKLASIRLGTMYRQEDYPTAGDIVRRYGIELQFGNIPMDSDIRVHLPESERKKIAADVKARTTEAIEYAMTDAWARLGEVVEQMRERLDDGNVRESMVAKVKNVAEAMGRLNITNNTALERTRTQVLKDLGKLDAKSMREDDKAASAAVKKADAILDKMKSAGFYTPAA